MLAFLRWNFEAGYSSYCIAAQFQQWKFA